MAIQIPEPEFPEMDASETVDLRQIEYNLRLSPSQRLEQLDKWLQFIRGAHRAFRTRNGFDPADLDQAQ
jgi:hypothetical protein